MFSCIMTKEELFGQEDSREEQQGSNESSKTRVTEGDKGSGY